MPRDTRVQWAGSRTRAESPIARTRCPDGGHKEQRSPPRAGDVQIASSVYATSALHVLSQESDVATPRPNPLIESLAAASISAASGNRSSGGNQTNVNATY